MLAEEEAKFKLELSGRGDAPEGRSPVNAATENRVEHDERSSEAVASRKATDPRANRLLGLLSRRDYQRLRPHLHRIPLEYRQSHPSTMLISPLDTSISSKLASASLVNTMANGQATEVGTIGNEGLVGLPLVFGDDRAPTSVYVRGPRCRPEE